jgi:hypothetical protein
MSMNETSATIRDPPWAWCIGDHPSGHYNLRRMREHQLSGRSCWLSRYRAASASNWAVIAAPPVGLRSCQGGRGQELAGLRRPPG